MAAKVQVDVVVDVDGDGIAIVRLDLVLQSIFRANGELLSVPSTSVDLILDANIILIF